MQVSEVRKGNQVTFPAFTGERVYMRKFMRGEPLPVDLARWQPTVNQMLRHIVSSGPVFLMVDQAEVPAGATQRRPGVHLDGYWQEGFSCHGNAPQGSHVVIPSHSRLPAGHRHPNIGGHSHPGTHIIPGHRLPQGGHASFGAREALVIATDVLGCEALVGSYEGAASDGGDCSHLDTAGLKRVAMTPGRSWVGETGSLLHESLPVERDCLRTVVRLNVTNWGS